MAPLCWMWCFWRVRNARSFDDCENGLLDLKKLVLQTLYTWRVAWNTLSVSTFFSEVLALCYFLWVKGSLVYILCTWVAPLCILNEYTLFIKKRKEKKRAQI